jgi:uncharacterized protein YndB with AHSA1/START domain
MPHPEPLAVREITVTRLLDAPRELVFDAWTERRHLVQWWGPRGFSVPSCEVDARVGGRLDLVMRSDDGIYVHTMNAVFTELARPERLAFTATASDERGRLLLETATTVTFTERDGKTEVTVHARGAALVDFATMMLDGMEQGWTETIDRLGEFTSPLA